MKTRTQAPDTRFPMHDLLVRRWSPRAFSSEPVNREKLGSLLEAARWAPSSFNEQPWQFIIAVRENPPEYERMLSCLVEFNQKWARTAPVLMISVAKLAFDKNGKPNRHAFHDVGLAAACLTVQATAMDLYVHQMAGFDVEKTKKTYGIPDGFEPVAAFALGYAGDPAVLPPELAEKEKAPRVRKPLESFVFTGQWKEPFPLGD